MARRSPRRRIAFRQEEKLHEPRDPRAIDAVCDRDFERFGNYVPTVLPRRHDAFLDLDETKALHPLRTPARPRGPPGRSHPAGSSRGPSPDADDADNGDAAPAPYGLSCSGPWMWSWSSS